MELRTLAPAVLVLLGGACVDKVSEDDRACPCGDGRTCCFDVCMPEGDSCAIEETIGLGGGTLTAPNGATLEIPFGALEEDTVIRMRSVDAEPVDGVTLLGGAVVLEPQGVVLHESGTLLTLPFDIDRVPSDADPDDVTLHSALPGGRAYQRGIGTVVTATTMQVAIYRFALFVPAVSQFCPYIDHSTNENCGVIERSVDGTSYRVECGDALEVTTSCRCVEDGVETRTVDAFCGAASEVYLYECGFPCPGEAPPIMPDAGAFDAAPPI